MIIIPSIDLKNGQFVRLLQGDFEKTTVYGDKPEIVALNYQKQGATCLHVVDLDGAKNAKLKHLEIIKKLKENFKNTVQVGGGIRETEDIEALLNCGVDRVVIGSAAVKNINKTLEWFETFGPNRLVLALDFLTEDNTPYLAVHAWQEKTKTSLWSLLEKYPKLVHLLSTDISQDGMEKGPNFNFYKQVKDKYPNLKIQASGGVSTKEDILKLKEINVYGAIIGKALYEKKLSLKEALQCAE